MSTTIAKTAHTPRSLVTTSDAVRDQLAAALPRFYTADQFLVIARTAINKNPKLEECTPESFMTSLLTAAQMGIPVDGRYGHLIPRKNKQKGVMECQFQADYKGLVRLVRMNDAVADIYADLVCDADFFEITKGLHRDIIHKIDIRKPRGPILGAYAVIQYKEGNASFEFMQRTEIEVIRDRSDGYKAFKAGFASSTPWQSDEGEMFKKTVLKRLLKLADLTPDTTARLAHDVDAEVTRVELEPQPIQRAQVPAIQDSTAALTNGAEAAEPAEQPKARRPRVEKPTPAPAEEAPLPGAEPEPAAAAGIRVPDVDPALPPLEKLRAICAGYSDAQILQILARHNLAEPSVKNLDAVPVAKIERALTDPQTLIGELSELTTTQA